MANNLKSVLVLQPAWEKLPALKPFLNEQKLMACEVLGSEAPFYLRLKVALPYEGKIYYTEILLPHSAVLMILIDAPQKTLGFR